MAQAVESLKTKRKLASVQVIGHLAPIAGADRIEVASVLGWKVVVKKGEFQVGDTCVYIEVDGFLPVDDARFAFLRDSSYKKNDLIGEGFRIRTAKLRKQVSQGLAFPMALFPELNPDLLVGEDVTELLGIRKYEEPEMITGMGTAIGPFSPVTSKTDETRAQSIPALIEALQGMAYYVATKLDGTSATIEVRDGVVRAYNRSKEILDDEKSDLWRWIHKHKVDEKMKLFGKDFSLQGELCGPSIQKNRLKLSEQDVFFFNVNDAFGQRQSLQVLQDVTETLNLKTVPIDEAGIAFAYTLDELLEKAKGRYPSGIHREGIVIRPQTPFEGPEGSPLSFKVLNNDFLLKEES